MHDRARILDDHDLLPLNSFGYRIWMLRHAWTRRMEGAISPTGLTHMQFFVLRVVGHLCSHGTEPSQARIADALRIDRMTVSKVVRTLEAKGMIERAVHPRDPRANSVRLAAPAMAVLDRAIRLAHAEQERFFGALGQDGKAMFSTMLDTLLASEFPDGPACGVPPAQAVAHAGRAA